MFAITGAAPVPVPPPSPAVMKSRSAPWIASAMRVESSFAALRPTSGLAPAPRPLVSFVPIWSFDAASECARACRSVLAAMNFTPSMPALIIEFTALPPPPPTPMTRMSAPSIKSSSISKFIRPPSRTSSRISNPIAILPLSFVSLR